LRFCWLGWNLSLFFCWFLFGKNITFFIRVTSK
jgi:hypothetical protein